MFRGQQFIRVCIADFVLFCIIRILVFAVISLFFRTIYIIGLGRAQKINLVELKKVDSSF